VFKDENGETVPGLAESWSREDDLTWRLNIRRGATFHNGDTVNAQAVKWSLESVKHPENGFGQRAYLESLESIEIIDDYTLLLHLAQPSRTILTNLVLVPIVSPRAVEERGDRFAVEPVASGPYRVV